MSDEGRSDCGEDDPGGAVMYALAADPDAAMRHVDAKQPITVCPRTPHV
jgi:hypothetical protein